MQWPCRARSWFRFACICSGLFTFGCSDGLTATSAGERYACSTTADCVSGFRCDCGICQPSGVSSVCPGGDTQSLDTQSDVADSLSSDTGPVDVAVADIVGVDAAEIADTSAADSFSGPCNLVDWTPCGAGQGCYFDTAHPTGQCLTHGNLGQNASCKANLTECGLSDTDRPMLCDTLDLKCYPTCQWNNLAAFGCNAGQTCYKLTDSSNQPLPGGAGICVPGT